MDGNIKQEERQQLEGTARVPPILFALVGVAAAVIIFWGIRSLSFILGPLVLALVITIAALPLPGWFIKKGLKSGVALVLTILTVVIVIAIVFLAIVGSLASLAGLFPSSTSGTVAQTTAVAESTPVPTVSAAQTPAVTPSTTTTSTVTVESFQAWLDSSLPSLNSIISSVQISEITTTILVRAAQAAAQLLMVLFIFGFMLVAALSMRGRMVAGFRMDSPGVKSFQQFTIEVRQYVGLMTVVNLLVAAGDTLLLWLIGVPSPFLWGALAFLMGYVPVVGWWVSVLPPFFIAWAEYGLGTALIVLVGYTLINGGVQNIVQPRIMGRGLRMSPLVVFISVTVWATLLGWMGALTAVPLSLIVIKVLDGSESTRWLAALMRIGSEGESDESSTSR